MTDSNTTLQKKGKVDIDRDILLSIINLATKEINGVACLTNDYLPFCKNKASCYRGEEQCLKPYTKEQYPFGTPFYLLVDMQIGGNWVGEVDPNDYPVEMWIDRVTFYAYRIP